MWRLIPILLVLLFAGVADARFPPRGSTTPSGGGGNTIANAVQTMNGEAGVPLQFGVSWSGTQPAAITSASWNNGGGTATISHFAVQGNIATFYATVPVSANTYTLSITADTGASTTFAGVVITAPGNDLATFPAGTIYGPDTPTLGQNAPLGNNFFAQLPFATYFVRGMLAPPTITLTDTAGHTGDALYFDWRPQAGGADEPAYNMAFALCVGRTAGHIAPYTTQTAFYVDINITDGFTSLVKHVVVQNPASGWIFFNPIADYQTLGGSFAPRYTGNLVTDAVNGWQNEAGTGVVYVGYLFSDDGSAITFTDPSGVFGFSGSSGGTITVNVSSLNAAHYGDYPITVHRVGGANQTLHLYIAHEWTPTIAYTPAITIYSSQPTTNGYGSWPLGRVHAYSDQHGGALNLPYEQRTATADPGGYLQIRWDGTLFLKRPLAGPGILTATIQSYSISGKTTQIALNLPILSGTTLNGANLSGVITGGLDNYLVYANDLRVNYQPSSTPLNVIALTASGMTPNWSLTQIDIQNPGPSMTTIDNAQLEDGINVTAPTDCPFGCTTRIPRYQLTNGSGQTATIIANDLSATDFSTPKHDIVVITVSDGAGKVIQNSFDLSISWHTSSKTEVVVGPSNANYPSPDYPDVYNFQQAAWTDYAAHGAAATMAGATVRLLRGVPAGVDFTVMPNTGWGYPGSGSLGYTNGWWPYPLRLLGDDSTQASFTGQIGDGSGGAGNVLNIPGSVTGPGLYGGDYIASGVGANKVMLLNSMTCPGSFTGTCWQLSISPTGTSTITVSSAAMTTKMPRIALNFHKELYQIPGGSKQGCIMSAGGYDLQLDNVEIYNCSNDYASGNGNGASIWAVAYSRGNLVLNNVYMHDGDNGILNNHFGQHIHVDRTISAKNGNGGQGNHNFYIGIAAEFKITNSQSRDVWRVHDLKTRAMINIYQNDIVVDGINGAGANPCEITIGGDSLADNVTCLHAANTSLNIDTISFQYNREWDLSSFTWAAGRMTIQNSTILNFVPNNGQYRGPGSGVQSLGWAMFGQAYDCTVNLWAGTPFVHTIQNNKFWNMPSGNWISGCSTDSGGNTALATYPATALEIVDPVTGTPPYNLPSPGAFAATWGGSPGSIGSAPGTYGTSLTVASGAPSGTTVNNGLLAALDFHFQALTSPTYSLANISGATNNNSSFTLTPSGSNVILKTNGALADGVYLVEIQATGTGYNGSTTTSMTVNNGLVVIVGNWN